MSPWPETWGSYRHESAIGVLTPYSDQVARIRHALRKKGLYSVSVERVLNVQGKQFRAVFLSTVRSFRPWVKVLPEAIGNEVDLGFFSNPKLFNTALTRAQSLVAVVGDPVSLCSEGKCRNLWKDFINVCHKNKSLYGISYTQLEQNILGLEMRVTWGLNPLADVFEPKTRPADYLHNSTVATSFKASQAQPSSHDKYTPQPASIQPYNIAAPATNHFTSSNSVKQHLVASTQQHRPISPGNTNTGYSQGHNPPVMWGQGHVPPAAMGQQHGHGAPPLQPTPYNIGYPPIFPPGGPHVMYPHPMSGYPSGPPNIIPSNISGSMVLPHPPAHLRMSIPRSGGPRFPTADIGHSPHMPNSHHLPQNMLPPPRPNFPPVSNQQQFEPISSLGGPIKNLPHQYNEEHIRFSSAANSTPHLPHNQSYRQPQPPQSLTQEQYVAGPPLYQNTSPHHMISETQQQPSSGSSSLSNSLNFHDGGIAHLPLSDLLHLQQMLERFTVTNGPTEELQNLLTKVQEAIYLARGRGVTHERHEIQAPAVPVNRNIWAPAPDTSAVHLNSSRIASIAQQLSEVQIAEAADSIWANLGFSDGISSSAPADHHQHQPSQNRRVDASPLMQEPLLSSAYMRPSGPDHSRAYDGLSHNTWSPSSSSSAQPSSSYGSLTAQLSSNDNYNISNSRQQEHFEPGNGGGVGRSYANVARRAVVTTSGPTPSSMTMSSNLSSCPPPPNLYSNDSSSVPPYSFYNLQSQQDARVPPLQQQQQQPQIMQNLIQQSKRNKRLQQ